MKKLSIWTIALVGVAAFSSCSSDRDSNPVLTVPQSFEMLVPEIGDNVINLENSESVRFRAKAAPDYGFPTETSYWVEIAETNDFSDPAKVAATDTKGKSITYDAPANEIDFAIMQLRGYEEESQVDKSEVITLYARMVACPTNATAESNYVYSNVQSFKVTSYFLKEALPELWYLTGGGIGDGGWGCDYAVVGTKMIPMYVKAGEEYNRFTGKGTIEYIGYFLGGQGFKIMDPKGVAGMPQCISQWMYGMCGDGHDIADESGYAYRDGGDEKGNIDVATSGYYQLILDTEEHELKTAAYEPDEAPVVYESMTFGDVELAKMTTVDGVPNHDWFGTITLAAPAEILFKAGNGTEWGTESFPYGIATNDGNKIPVDAGTYVIYFNDITGAFMFTEQEDE